MAVVPNKAAEKIQFYRVRVTPWTDNAEAIGTTPAEVADLNDMVEAAQDALSAQRQAQDKARAATLSLQIALDALATKGAAIISEIRAKAKTTGDGVYEMALVPPTAAPTPMPAPGKPHNFGFSIDATGALTLTWKCDNPPGSSGTMYQIWRRVGADAAFIFIGASGEKRFVDMTVPAGSASIIYQIQAVRSTAVGQQAQFPVNLGVSDGAAMPQSIIVKIRAARIAA